MILVTRDDMRYLESILHNTIHNIHIIQTQTYSLFHHSDQFLCLRYGAEIQLGKKQIA